MDPYRLCDVCDGSLVNEDPRRKRHAGACTRKRNADRVSAAYYARKAAGEMLPSDYVPRPRVARSWTCKVCGDLFFDDKPRASLCSITCRRRHQADRNAQWLRDYASRTGQGYMSTNYGEQRRAAAKRRRVALRGGETEVFLDVAVFERDLWTCALCALSIDPLLTFPHRGSASLDHILPVSLGGAHTLANVQAAHLGCNCAKRDRV